jgi:DNA-binding response OmpR family regulator
LDVLEGRKKSVLIVEDEFLIALDMEAALQDAGYSVCGIAATRAEALALAQADRPDIALVDLHLADGVTGPSVGAALVDQGTRVIFVTANPALVVGRVAGALGVLTKPADTGTLLDVVGWAALGAGQTPPPGLQPIAG